MVTRSLYSARLRGEHQLPKEGNCITYPVCLEDYFNFVERKKEEKIKIQNSSLTSESSIMQRATSIFKNLLRVSGLDDREWEVRVFDNPGEWAICYYLLVHHLYQNSKM